MRVRRPLVRARCCGVAAAHLLRHRRAAVVLVLVVPMIVSEVLGLAFEVSA